MTIHLHINQISIQGLDIPRHQRPQLQAALEAELGRLLTTQGIPPGLRHGVDISRLPGLTLTGKPSPTQVGQQAAQLIYNHLGGTNLGSGTTQSQGELGFD
jgi:hypothetical protein